MTDDDMEDRLSRVESAVERLEHTVIAREGQADPLAALAEQVTGALDDWRADVKARREPPQVEAVLAEFGRHTDQFLRAIRQNTAATNDLLTSSNARLAHIESELADTGPLADPAVQEEGRFLKAQLTGLEGTEIAGPKFKDATPVTTPSGFEVLAAAVNELSPDDGVE
jgi:hypothetical protein